MYKDAIFARDLEGERLKHKRPIGRPVIIAASSKRKMPANVTVYEAGVAPVAQPKPVQPAAAIETTGTTLTAEQVAAELEAEEMAKATIPPAPGGIPTPEPELEAEKPVSKRGGWHPKGSGKQKHD